MKKMRLGKLLLLLNLGALASAQTAPPIVSVSTPTLSTSTSADGVCQEGSQNCVAPSWEKEFEKAKVSWGACQQDVNALCEGIQVGEGRIERCLKAHKVKLSKKCRAQIFHSEK